MPKKKDKKKLKVKEKNRGINVSSVTLTEKEAVKKEVKPTGYSFEIDAVKLTRPVETISSFHDEMKFEVTESGLHLLLADRSMVAVSELLIKKEAFSKFRGVGEFSVISKDFTHMLKRFGSGNITIEKDEDNRIAIKGGYRRFTLWEIMDFKSEKPPIEQLNFEGRYKIGGEALWEAILDAQVAGEVLIMEASKTGLALKSRPTYGEGISTESETKTNILDFVKQTTTTYPLEYLEKLKIIKDFREITIEFGPDYPCRITGENSNMKFTFILAPRVEE